MKRDVPKGLKKKTSIPSGGETALKAVLTIGGHDLSNGAGFTKDLEIFTTLGFHGISIPTSLVVQGPKGVESASPIPDEVFEAMLLRVGEDFIVSGVKIGVLADALHVARVGEFLARLKGVPVVLDPVLAAKNGKSLITRDGLKGLVEQLFPMATCLTPNVEEAQILVNAPVDSVEAMERAARKLAHLGPSNVVLKGGHLKGDPVDLLFDCREVVTLRKERIEKVVHGTGCMFSAALLSFLALGYPVREAFLETEQVMEDIIRRSSQPSKGGYFYGHPGVEAGRAEERREVLQAMHAAAVRLEELNAVELIPAVQMNVGYAVRGALSTEDVAAFPGRIGHLHGKVHFKGAPEFGASSHVARLCLACMRRYPYLRAAANIKYDPAIVEKARRLGLSVVFADRREEPEATKGEEGRSLDFIVEEGLRQEEGPPDLIYDLGDVGKEPIIRLFARGPQELIKKMEMIKPCKTS